MPRKKLIRTDQFCYHVHSRSNNKEWFYIPLEDVWKYFVEHLQTGKKHFKIEIHGFVLMSNHYHLLIRTPESNIDKFMQFFNQSLGKSISAQAGRINRIFGSPYKWSLIDDQNYYETVYRYILQNPLRKNLVERIEMYPYSSQFQKRFHLLVDIKNLLTNNFDDFEWLNSAYTESKCDSIRVGLTRPLFTPKVDHKDRRREFVI